MLLCAAPVMSLAARTPPAHSMTPTAGSVARLDTLKDCSLAVSIYPTFSYNALGGGGRGRVVAVDGDVVTVEFDACVVSNTSLCPNIVR